LGSLDLGSLGFDALVPESPSLSVHLVFSIVGLCLTIPRSGSG
jgi:hypothetical protein